MRKYKYIVGSSGGKIKKGIIEAFSRAEASDLLRRGGGTLIELKRGIETPLHRKIEELDNRFSPKQQADLFRGLSYLIPVGNSIHSSLAMMLTYNKNKSWQKTVRKIMRALDDTGSLSAALRASGNFGNEVVYQVLSGEESGNLPEVLEKLSQKFEQKTKYLKRFYVLMVYPAFLLAGLFAAASYMSSDIIPRMLELVEEMNGEIPEISGLVIAFSNAVSRHGVLYLVFAGFLVCLFALLMKIKRIRFALDAYKLKIPIVGAVLRDSDIVRFSSVFASMYESGNELETVLTCSAETIRNTYLASLAQKASKEIIEAGTDFTKALSQSGIFAPDEVQLISVGAETYSLSGILDSIADKKSYEIDNKIIFLINSAPVVSIAIVGIFVGVFALGIYLMLNSITGAGL